MLKSEPTSPYKKAILFDSGLKQDTFFALTFFSLWCKSCFATFSLLERLTNQQPSACGQRIQRSEVTRRCFEARCSLGKLQSASNQSMPGTAA